MILLSGYQILQKIYASSTSIIYRGIRESDQQKVIIKILNKDYPTTSELDKFKEEYQITKSFNCQGIIKVYSLVKYQNSLALIFEDFGGESLKLILSKKHFSLVELLEIAIKIAIALEEIHSNNIIHKNLNANNIIYNCHSKELKIIDFSLASRLKKENYLHENKEILSQRLAYISPEQTGRINLNLDYRTDFYSLGITLYELLTGQLPYQTQDSLELIHCHLSISAIAPHTQNPSIPEPLSDIVMKLMAKNPQQRYQSAWGLREDLQKCLQQLKSSQKINNFILGSHDISDKFILPQKLYGRSEIINNLLNQCSKITTANTTKMILIAGYSGSGKSSLVQSIYKQINQQKAYFISGKFDQFQRNIPYTALINALKKLVRQKLKESPEKLQTWKNNILSNIGNNGQIIINVIPEIELIIGKQPPVVTLSAEEEQNKFNFVFRQFIMACATKDNPLVIFFDDLQWADNATIKLIKLMMANRHLKYLCLMGTYRNNEVKNNPHHPLNLMINQIKQSGDIIEEYYLDNLTFQNVNKLIADTLQCDLNKVKMLSKLVFSKTKGNPFFTKQFLQTLYLKRIIYFDYQNYQWQWDSNRISDQNITDNVVDLIISQLNIISKPVQNILKLSACLGNTFDLSSLSIILKKSTKKIAENLIIATNMGFILPLSLSDNRKTGQYQFLHDRIQQAAYMLIPEQKKPEVHLKIGTLLLKKYTGIKRKKHLFEILLHLNLGKQLITDQSFQKLLAKLNLMAGIKAKKANAYNSANLYLQTALELLNAESWQTEYKLTLNIYTHRAEIAYVNGNVREFNLITKEVINHGKNIIDKIIVYKLSIAIHTGQSRMKSAIAIGRKVLQELGIKLPTNIDLDILKKKLKNIDAQLKHRPIKDLIYLPSNDNSRIEAIIEILGMLYPAFFQAVPELLTFASFTMVSLSLRFGHFSGSAIGYILHGMILCTVFEEVDKAYSFGCLAIDLIDRYPNQKFKHLAIQIFGAIIQPRREKLTLGIDSVWRSYHIGLEVGDLINANYSFLMYAFMRFFAGVELEVIESELADSKTVVLENTQVSTRLYLDMMNQCVHNLRHKSSQPDCLQGIFYDESVNISKHYHSQELVAIAQVYIYKLLLAYLFGDYQKAQKYLNQVKPYLSTVASIIFYPTYHFYAALTHVGLWHQSQNQQETLPEIESHQDILQQWASNAPMNYGAMWHLVEAEKQRVLDNKTNAIDNYEQAIQLAQEHNYINIRAIANELAGKFYLDWGQKKLAQYHLLESFYNYSLWGANAKTIDLAEKYPQFFSNINLETDSISTQRTNDQNNLDLLELMYSSQAITGEIVLENLYHTLIKILIDNSQAQRGCLLLSNSHKPKTWQDFTIVIDIRDGVSFLNPRETMAKSLPGSIVNHIINTSDYLCLENPSKVGNFTRDSYLKSHQPSSIICYPLINQGVLVGIVYLENHSSTNTCSLSSRLEVLQLLSGQAAIALTNAKLYHQIKENKELLKQFLEAMPIGVAVIEKNGQPYYTNQKAQQILGKGVLSDLKINEISSNNNIYKTGTNKIYPNDQLPILRALTGEICSNDQIEIHHDNKIIPLESWGIPIYDKLGQVQFAMTAFYDITQHLQAQKVLKKYNEHLEKEVKKRTTELEKANKQLHLLVNLDSLTQIPNRRRFDEYLKLEWQRHQRQKENISLLLIDIDYFKPYNDYYGHQQGDDCLTQVAQTIVSTIKRPTDLAARYGGEEFVIILPHTPSKGALTVAKSVQKAIFDLKIPHHKSLISEYVTLSIGVATVTPSPKYSPEDLIEVADECLYRAKEKGRNRIMFGSLVGS